MEDEATAFLDMRNSKRFYQLPSSLPDKSEISLREVQSLHDLANAEGVPFSYTGTALLTGIGEQIVRELSPFLGRCLGGGALHSPWLDWFGNEMSGAQPVPPKIKRSLFGKTCLPKVKGDVGGEWIAFEYALALMPSRDGLAIITKWDDVVGVTVYATGKGDWLARLEIRLGEAMEMQLAEIHLQTNRYGISTLERIASACGVPTFIC